MPQDVKAIVDEFFEQFRLRTYAKGQILILSGEKHEQIYYLSKGRVKVYDVSLQGDEIVVNSFKPGAFFPLSLALNQRESPFIYEAETAIEVRQAPSAQVVEFLKSNPAVMLDLLARVYRGLDGLMGRTVQMATGSARHRVVYELLVEARRFGEERADGSWSVPAHESSLAIQSGLSRETVSREFHKLKQEKLIIHVGQRLEIPNLEALEALLG